MNTSGVTAHFGKYAVSYTLAFLLAFNAGMQGYIDVFERLTRPMWDAMAWWQITVLFVKPLQPVAGTLIAFFNNSLVEAQKGTPHVTSETHTDTKSVSP